MANYDTIIPSPKKGDLYFAASEPKNLASICLSKSQSFFNVQQSNQYLDKLRKNWAFYHGIFNDDNDSHSVGFGGEQGELCVLPVNHYRNIAQHMLVMITSNRPSMEARAVNTDYKSLSQTYLANGILDYYMREKMLEDVIRRATEMAIVLGAGYVRAEWNATRGDTYDFDEETGEKSTSGEIEFSTHSPFDVVFDGTKDTWDNEWIIIRTKQNRFNLIAKYPEFESEIRAIPAESSGFNYRTAIFSNDDTDDIPVYEFYHKKTEALPEGRYFLFLSPECPLLDIPLPYRDIPIYRITAGDYMGSPYGYTPMFDVFPIQEGINSLYSAIMTNQNTFAVQNLFVKRGSDLNIGSLEGAMNIIEGNEQPVPLQMCATPKEVFDFLQMLITAAETISGVNAVARGDPQASLKSGTALALIQSMALQFISGLQNNYVRLIESVGSSLINILKDYAKTPMTIAIVGKNDRPLLKEFVGDDIGNIQRVIVSVGNPLAKTAAGRVQMAEQMLQMGLIKDPMQYFQVVETGQIKTMYESDMNTMLLIKHENELMSEGQECIVDILDEHSIHILEHRSVMSNPELRQDPTLRAIVQDHIQAHINFLRTVDPDLLMLIKQQPLQNPMAPQMVPPMGGQPGQEAGGMPSPEQQLGNTLDQTSQMMQNPNGSPQPGDMLNGQGSAGGNMIPQVPKPPAPFENLPTNPNQQG